MIRRFFQDSAVYMIPNLLSRGLGLILLPVYTRYLSPADYGVIEILAVLYTLLNLVLPLEISQAVARYTADEPAGAGKSAYVTTGFWFTAITFGAWVGVAAALPADIATGTLGIQGAAGLLPLASVSMLFNALFYLVLNQLRWNMQRSAYVTASLTFTAGTAATAVTLVVAFGYGVYGVIWGQLAGSVLGLVASLICLRETSPIRFRMHRTELHVMLGFSAPLVLSSIAVYLATYTDRWVLGMWLGMDGVGIYSVAYRIASVIALLTGSVQLAVTPLVYRHYRSPGTADTIRQVFELFLFATFSLVAAVACFAQEIIALVAGPQFAGASAFAGPLSLAVLLLSISVFAPGLAIAKRTGRIAAANGAGAAAGVTANLVLVPSLGIMGAVLGTSIGAAAAAVLRFRWSQRHYFIPFRWRRYGLAFAALLLVLWLMHGHSLSAASRLLVMLASTGIFAALLIDRDAIARRKSFSG